MIYTPAKAYQLVLWEDGSRRGDALRLDFDSAEEAGRVLAEKELEGKYRCGILVEWNKKLRDWTLINQYGN